MRRVSLASNKETRPTNPEFCQHMPEEIQICKDMSTFSICILIYTEKKYCEISFCAWEEVYLSLGPLHVEACTRSIDKLYTNGQVLCGSSVYGRFLQSSAQDLVRGSS